MLDRLGVQTFTIRKLIKNSVELRKTLTELGEMGYTHFELARMKYNREELAVLKELQERYHFTYVTCQIKMDVIIKRFDWLMEFSRELKIPTIEVSVIPLKSFLKKREGMLELAEELNALGSRTKEYGVELLYHHHNYELILMDDELGLIHLFNHTDPDLVNFVIDTYWLARSGFNPYSFIKEYEDRVRGVHLRDCNFYHKALSFKFRDEVVGRGSIDFKMFKSDKLENILFFSVEQDSKNPIEDLKLSYIYLKEM